MKGKQLFVLAAAGLLVLAGCGKTPTPDPVDPVTPDPVDPEPGPGPEPGPSAEAANGVFSYTNSSDTEKTKILGALEKYAVDNKLTGLVVVENGGYVMYKPSLTKGAPKYIKGYGFGTLPEGSINEDLAGEEDAKYKRYYHDFETEDPGNILYMDDKGSVVADLVGFVGGSPYDIVMNEERNGYVWVGDLATNDAPIAVNPDANGASNVYRFPVKTGEALKYSTLSEVPAIAAFNNRPVAIEDYITPYKALYTSFYGMKRNGEQKDSEDGSLVGTNAYVAASKTGFNAEAFANLGIKAGHSDELGDYLEFTLNKKYTPFWARYYVGGGLFSPVPESFIEQLGGGDFAAGLKVWGKFKGDELSPVDTYLSTGPYTIETWNFDSLITFKRNPNYVSGTDRKTTRPNSYNIQGVHMAINKAAKDNVEAAFNEYMADKLHAVAIPSTKIEQYYNHPDTTIVPGTTSTKLNLNTCDQETWEELFGENGTIVQTPKENYWELKPAMSNKHFIDGLSYAIDRKTMAAKIGRTPSCDFFGSSYYADAENGIFYNDTQEHKDAMAASLEGTDEYGYSLEKAKVAFKLAADELLASGAYKKGDTIKIEMTWQSDTNVTNYGNPIAKYCEDAFNAATSDLTLKFEHFVVDYWEKAYDEKMQIGQFDIGFGAINGNPYNPLGCMEWLKSDNSSSFTLNWGVNTNKVADLEYDGKLWTYDALWEAACNGVYAQQGRNTPMYVNKINQVVLNQDGSATITGKEFTVSIKDENNEVLAETATTCMCLYATTDTENYSDYGELYFNVDGSTDIPGVNCTWTYGDADADGYRPYTIVLPAEFVSAWVGVYPQTDALTQGIDCYRTVATFGGEPAESYFGTIWEGLLVAA